MKAFRAFVWETTSLILIIGLAFASFEGHSAKLTMSMSPPPQLVLQAGHAMRVDGLAFSPDGQLLVTGSADNAVRIWEVASGRELRTLAGHARGVKAVAFSHDARWLASGSIDGSVKLWDVTTGHEQKNLPNNGSVSVVAISLDGRFLAVGNMEGRLTIFDVVLGSPLFTFSRHRAAITTLAFSPNSSLLASGSADHLIVLWDLATGLEAHNLKGHDDKISALGFSPDSQLLASGGSAGKLKLWQVGTAREQRTINGFGEPLAILFSADATSLSVASANNTIRRWSVTTGRELPSSVAGGDEFLEAIQMTFSPDGRLLASSSGDKTVQLRDTATGTNQRTLATRSYGVYSATFSPDSKWFVSGGRENTIRLWEVASGRQVQTLDPNGGFVNALAFSIDSKLLASGNLSGGIDLWEAETGRKSGSLVGHASSVNALAFSPNGKWLASGSGDRSVKLWDVETHQEIRTFNGHTAEVYALCFSADSRQLATGGADKTIKLWEVAGNETITLTGHEGEVSSVVFYKDVKRLASASEDKTIRIWDLNTRRQASAFTAHAGQIKALTISRDGRQLASGGSDSVVKLWDAATGREIRALKGHFSEVYCVAFSPDDRWLASGSDDGSTHLWNARSGDVQATLVSLRENVSGLAKGQSDWLVVAPDGLFDGSPDAWHQILWRFDGKTLNIRPVEVFFNEFFHPGLLSDILAGKKPAAPKAIAEVDRRQPLIAVKTKEESDLSGSVAARDLAVRIDVRESPSDTQQDEGSGARDVRVFRNGSLVKVWRGDVLNGQSHTTLETMVPLVAGENVLTAYAFNRANIKSGDATLTVIGSDSLKRSATAYILAVGVNTYSNTGYNLKLAVADANDFSHELRRSQETVLGRFSNVEVVPLLNQEATKANIQLALKRLSGSKADPLPKGAPPQLERLKPSQPEDAVVLYFAGHGLANQSQFYLLPHDLGYKGPRRGLNRAGLGLILAHSISDRELEQSFETVQAGQILLVLDACNSGQALEAEEKRRGPMNSRGLAQLAYEKGIFILTAAQSYQAALEVTELGHGLLTYVLVEEGLRKAMADVAPRDGKVLLREWLDFAIARVPELQLAKMRRGRSVGTNVAFVEGDEQLSDVEKRDLQRPRVFYRRDSPVPVIAVRATPAAAN